MATGLVFFGCSSNSGGGGSDAGQLDGSQLDGSQLDGSQLDAAQTDAGTGVDLTGTWISHLTTTGTLTAPLVGTVTATIDVIQRIVVTVAGGQITNHFQICSLDTSGVNMSGLTFATVYPQAALDTFQVTESLPATVVNVGDMVPLPNFQILSGWDAQMNPVDSDGDGTPGTLVNAVLQGNTLPSNIGITISTNIMGTLTDPNTISGMVAFGTDGQVFDIMGLPPPGSDPSLTVTTDQPTVSFTSTRLDGDVPCSSVITMF